MLSGLNICLNIVIDSSSSRQVELLFDFLALINIFIFISLASEITLLNSDVLQHCQ